MYFKEQCRIDAKKFEKFDNIVKEIILKSGKKYGTNKIHKGKPSIDFIASHLLLEGNLKFGYFKMWEEVHKLPEKLIDKIYLNGINVSYSEFEIEQMKKYINKDWDLMTKNNEYFEIIPIEINPAVISDYLDFPVSISKLNKTKAKYLILCTISHNTTISKDSIPFDFCEHGHILVEDVKKMICDKRRLSKDNKQLFLIRKDFKSNFRNLCSHLTAEEKFEKYSITNYKIQM